MHAEAVNWALGMEWLQRIKELKGATSHKVTKANEKRGLQGRLLKARIDYQRIGSQGRLRSLMGDLLSERTRRVDRLLELTVKGVAPRSPDLRISDSLSRWPNQFSSSRICFQGRVSRRFMVQPWTEGWTR